MAADPIISEDQLSNALRYMAETDHEYAHEKAELERAEIHRKRVRYRLFLVSDGTVADRQAKADTAQETEAADEAYCKRIEAFEILKAKRERAEIIVRVFQTLEATRRSKL